MKKRKSWGEELYEGNNVQRWGSMKEIKDSETDGILRKVSDEELYDECESFEMRDYETNEYCEKKNKIKIAWSWSLHERSYQDDAWR